MHLIITYTFLPSCPLKRLNNFNLAIIFFEVIGVSVNNRGIEWVASYAFFFLCIVLLIKLIAIQCALDTPEHIWNNQPYTWSTDYRKTKKKFHKQIIPQNSTACGHFIHKITKQGGRSQWIKLYNPSCGQFLSIHKIISNMVIQNVALMSVGAQRNL